ncbi:hypothetical protein F5B19DRAFT_500475 [Rostrohypoxylon terebratum]|nr:hypothetical protein F5B19DRAFT_500475 [Rostrohypoxylon terebratum]
MCLGFGQFVTKVQKEDDEQLISELYDMVSTITYEGKLARYNRYLQSRRIRHFYTDMRNEEDKAQTDGQRPDRSGPTTPKIPRRCDRCKMKILIISPLCIEKGGCDRK